MSPLSSSALIWFSSWPFLLQFLVVSVSHRESAASASNSSKRSLVRCRQREKDSSRRPFWRCVSKNSELFPKAGQTGFLQGITESLVGITVPYLPAFVTLYGKFTSQSYNKFSIFANILAYMLMWNYLIIDNIFFFSFFIYHAINRIGVLFFGFVVA